MTQTLSCSQGHEWESPAAADAADLRCPVCGVAPSLPVASTFAETAPAPRSSVVPVIPGYEILGELGRGGMGVVYKARHIKLNRVVALKMLTAGAHAGSDLLQRFQREAESLARLTHPNIVQIHEVGWIEPHGPYLTLEYVEGGSLARKLDRAPQPPRQAAEIVALLARAVHFAHERGVLHRDLKPANVLLAPDGTPKVTDFGLARFLQAEASSADAPTPTGAVLGTPSYMAPEQASGVVRAPTAALDVYALGAVLYELLTGRPPFLAEGPLETILLVMTEDPVPPRRLQSKTPRDLETICLHCLRKTPRQRYPSAAALADDLQRFLDGKPIQVRPAGPVERMVKWARRRPAIAALLAVSVLAVMAGLGAWGWFQYQLYEKNAHLLKANADLEAEKDLYNNLLVSSVDAVSDYGDAVDEAVAPLSGGEQARRALLEKRLDFFAPFLELAPDNPKLQQRKARGLFEAAKIHQKLGDSVKAEREFNDAIDLYETAIAGSSETPDLRHDLGGACIQLGNLLYNLHRRDEAERQYNRGARLLQVLVDEGHTDTAFRQDLAKAYHNLAALQTAEKHWPEALDAFNKAVALCKGLVAEDDKEDRYKVLLAENYADCGGMYRVKGEPARGKDDVEAALALFQKVGPDFARQEGCRNSLAGIHYHRGLLAAATDMTAARKEFEVAAQLWDGLRREFPTVPRYRAQTADAQLFVGRLYLPEGRLAEAESALRRADELYSGLAEEWKDDAEYQGGRTQSHYFLGMVMQQQGNFDEAARLFGDLVEWAPDNAEYHMNYGIVCQQRADAEGELGRPLLLSLSAVGLTVVPNPLGCVGHLYSALNHLRTAAVLYRQSLEHLRRAEQDGRAVLDPTTRLAVARIRCRAAQGLARMGELLDDPEALNLAGETIGELAEGWESLNEPNDAAKNYRLASQYTSEALVLTDLDAYLPENERVSRATAYAEGTLRLLHKAVEKGYRNVKEMRGSVWLQALRNSPRLYLRNPRQDLNKLLAEMDDKPQP